MFANDGVECRGLLSDGGVPVWIDEVIERRDLVVHVRGWKQSHRANAQAERRRRAHPLQPVVRVAVQGRRADFANAEGARSKLDH